jgi:hypothetical protein
MVWAPSIVGGVEESGSRFARISHLSDDETVAKMGHPGSVADWGGQRTDGRNAAAGSGMSGWRMRRGSIVTAGLVARS